ncbi:MAG: hypothetical protein JXQ75_16595 [Phycisphaerae bacterium]|nr:hypothetical protein [Phycisphaerae bacterium]
MAARTLQPRSHQRSVVLIVCDPDDEPVRACVTALTGAGAHVKVVRDAYTAMAQLALGENISRVILDVRILDDNELSFQRVAARYYPSVEVMVPLLEGTGQRLATCDAGVRPVDVASIVASITTELAPALVPPAGHPPDEPVPDAAQPTLQRNTLSTDGGPESAPAGPSLHEAVRDRMASDDPRTMERVVRRRPPGASSREAPPAEVPSPPAAGSSTPAVPVQPTAGPVSTSNASQPMADAGKPALSPEEMNALLGSSEACEESARQTDHGDGEGAS